MKTVLPLWAMLALAAPIETAHEPTDSIPLFADAAPIEVTLIANFDELKGDRRGDTPERPAQVRLLDNDGAEVTLEAQLRTRGRFRRDPSNCTFPPLRLNLKKKQTAGTAFEGQDKLKIVGSCRPNRDSYEQLVLLEYLTYQAFERLTDTSYRTRLARITYVDESGEDDPFTRFAFFIEDDDALADRVGGTVFELGQGQNVPAGVFDPTTAALASVFQYMIGNTDWSDMAGHNMELIDMHGVALAVPYDFDFSGLVDAPYAIPAENLGIKNVTDRMYRGWCRDSLDYAPILSAFREAEEDIVGLFETFPYLDGGESARAARYLRAFFEDIQTDRRAERMFLRHCRSMPGT